MKYTTHLFTTKNTCVQIPFFSTDSGDKKEEENVKRMNSFYDELKRSVVGYSESDNFPKDGRYFAKAQILESGDSLEIRLTMRLRCGGKTVSSRILSHTWNDGVILEKRMTE